MTEDEIWKGDLLGRREEGKYLQRYIENLYKLDKKDQTSFVLNINSEWGHGKTWFLTRFTQQLKVNFPVVYFDAWKNDFTKDPLMSFVSVVCEELTNKFAGDRTAIQQVMAIKDSAIKFIKPSIPIILAALVKHYTGVNFQDLGGTKERQKNLESISDVISKITEIASSEAMEGFIKEKNAIEEFTNSLKALVDKIDSGKSNSKLNLPICIIIDELDRCRPTYAIELLEAIKHLFSVKGIFFILATDTQQLTHSIGAVYGQNFNAAGYLKRFFYSEYNLSLPEGAKVSDFLFENSNIQEKLLLPVSFSDCGVSGIFSYISDFFKLNIRDQMQVFSVLETITLTSDVKQFHLIFLSFLVCLRHKFGDEYKKLSNIKNLQELRTIISNKISTSELKNLILNGMYWQKGSGQPKEYNLKDLFETYFDFLAQKVSDLQYEFDGSGFAWTNEVRRQIVDSVSLNGPIDYFDLVNQSGKIKSLN